MPDTSFGGLTNFTRYYYAQVGKEAVIIDERFNGGGALATDIIEHLKRSMMSLVATRDWEDEVQPQLPGGIDDHGLYALTTYNRDAKWDWYEVGGRWSGFLKLKPGAAPARQGAVLLTYEDSSRSSSGGRSVKAV